MANWASSQALPAPWLTARVPFRPARERAVSTGGQSGGSPHTPGTGDSSDSSDDDKVSPVCFMPLAAVATPSTAPARRAVSAHEAARLERAERALTIAAAQLPWSLWVCVSFVLRGRDVRRFSVNVHSCGMICSIWV